MFRGSFSKWCTSVGALALAIVAVSARATPQTIRVDGSVFDNTGIPSTGSKDIQIKLYSASTGGSALWTSSVYNTTVTSGRFSINLDGATLAPYLAALASGGAAYFEVVVDTGTANGSMDTPITVAPRIRSRGTAFALAASVADTLTGVSATSAEINRLMGVTATAVEMNYLAGVTGRLQTQINNIVGGTADSFANLTDGATISVDGSNARIYRVTLGGNRTMANPSTIVSGRLYSFIVGQDATGGRRIAWDSKYKGTIPFPLTYTAVSGLTGTTIGNMTGGSGMAAAFNGDATDNTTTGAYEGTGATGYIGKDWGSGNSKIISRVTLYGTTDYGFSWNPGPVTITLQGSQNNSSWVDLYTTSRTTSANDSITFDSGITKTTAYRYHRIAILPSAAQWATIGEVEFYESSAPANSTSAYSFVSDGTNLYYTNDPATEGGGGTSVLTYTASRAMETDAAGYLQASSVLSSELGFLAGATANIQSQISSTSAASRLPLAGGSLSGALNSGSTITSTGTITGNAVNVSGASSASRFAMLDSSKNIVSSASTTTDTEFGYLSGVTSALNLKVNRFTATEAGYISGVTNGIQAQINTINTSTSYLTGVTSSLAKANMFTLAEAGYLAGVTSSLAKDNMFTLAEAGYLAGVTSSIGNKINLFTATESSYLAGVTQALQTQINALGSSSTTSLATKYDKTGGTLSGAVDVGAAVRASSFELNSNSGTIRTGGYAVLSVGTGVLSGNLFLGARAGEAVTSGTTNVFIGSRSGLIVSTAIDNTMVGYYTGENASGNANVFVGSVAGNKTTTGGNNAFVGKGSGYQNTTGSSNAYFGFNAGVNGTTGGSNVIIGDSAGAAVTTGSQMTLIGKGSNAIAATEQSTALGYNAVVSASSSIQLGAGTNSTANSLQFRNYNFLDSSGNATFNSINSTISSAELGYLDGVTVSLSKENLFTAAEASYLAGVTQALQTQLNAKMQTTVGNTLTGNLGLNYTNVTPNRVAYVDASRILRTDANVDSTELGYLDGVTSALDAKVNAFTATEATYLAGVTSNLGSKVNRFTATEAGYLAGVTAAIQTQINSLSPMMTNVITSSAQATVSSIYATNSASLLSVTLPAACAVGDRLKVVGIGSGGWKIVQNAGDYIDYSSSGDSTNSGSTTTAGTGGYLQSISDKAAVELLCRVANDGWTVTASDGLYTGNYVSGVSTYTSATTFTVPAHVRQVTLKAWGGGGGSGYANAIAAGAGGGGAYATITISVTPGEVLDLIPGAGGTAGSTIGDGGGGGGYSAIFRQGQIIVLAAGGGGGGGGRGTAGGAGGGGGFSMATSGVSAGSCTGGGAATRYAGGSAGVGDQLTTYGTAGAYLQGGNGGQATSAGVTPGGGGKGLSASKGGGGGGGGGIFGGGGGGTDDNSNDPGAGGGGGFSVGSSGTDGSAGSGTTAGSAGNNSDSDLAGASTTGAGATGPSSGAGSAGAAGKIIIKW